MGRSRTMRGTTHSVEGYPGWRPAKKLEFANQQRFRTQSLHTFCIPRARQSSSPASIVDLIADQRTPGAKTEKRPSKKRAKKDRSAERPPRDPNLDINSAKKELQSLGLDSEYIVETNSSGGLTFIPRAQKAAFDQRKDQDFISRMHELIFAPNRNSTSSASSSRCVESFTSTSSAMASNLSLSTLGDEVDSSSLLLDTSVAKDAYAHATFRLTYVHVKNKLIAEFGKRRFRRFQADVQHLMCEREKQHSRSVSLSTRPESTSVALFGAGDPDTAEDVSCSIDHEVGGGGSGGGSGAPKNCSSFDESRETFASSCASARDAADSTDSILGFAEAHRHNKHIVQRRPAALSSASHSSRLTASQMDVLSDRVSTIFDHPSGPELLFSSASFGQRSAMPAFYKQMEHLGIWCWALIVIDTAGRVFGCYSEVPFTERVQTCGKRDMLFSLSGGEIPEEQQRRAGKLESETNPGEVSFQSFEWNALTSSRLLAGTSQLRVSNRKGFDFCVYDGFSAGIRSASRNCAALADQPKEFRVAAVEVWVPGNLSHFART